MREMRKWTYKKGQCERAATAPTPHTTRHHRTSWRKGERACNVVGLAWGGKEVHCHKPVHGFAAWLLYLCAHVVLAAHLFRGWKSKWEVEQTERDERMSHNGTKGWEEEPK